MHHSDLWEDYFFWFWLNPYCRIQNTVPQKPKRISWKLFEKFFRFFDFGSLVREISRNFFSADFYTYQLSDDKSWKISPRQYRDRECGKILFHVLYLVSQGKIIFQKIMEFHAYSEYGPYRYDSKFLKNFRKPSPPESCSRSLQIRVK